MSLMKKRTKNSDTKNKNRLEMSLSWYQKYKEKGEYYIEIIYYKEEID